MLEDGRLHGRNEHSGHREKWGYVILARAVNCRERFFTGDLRGFRRAGVRTGIRRRSLQRSPHAGDPGKVPACFC